MLMCVGGNACVEMGLWGCVSANESVWRCAGTLGKKKLFQHHRMRLDHQSDADACVCKQVCGDVCVCNWVCVEVGQKSHQEDFFQQYQYDQAVKVIDVNACV